ncbi:MAG: endonuclease/exonuclease/phosphatase family protein [Candidatus Rokubacteria bacterium]|nr:endonuclease/exonuclease/phosphatase family protein [Candidatus Rokubacteria bacterium]
MSDGPRGVRDGSHGRSDGHTLTSHGHTDNGREDNGAERQGDAGRRSAILSVASYNIHRGRGLDRRTDLPRIAEVLREIDADVIGLQEVHEPQLGVLAEALGMSAVMGVTRPGQLGPYGNGVLSRLAIRATQTFDLSHRLREPRGGVRVDLSVAGYTLHLFNVHFGLALRERAVQVTRLVAEHILASAITGPRVVLGDLNEWFPGRVGRTLRRELLGPRMRRTHPAPMPLFPLDRIYWCRAVEADLFRVHRSPLARIASDHLPVVARLRIAGSALSSSLPSSNRFRIPNRFRISRSPWGAGRGRGADGSPREAHPHLLPGRERE